MKTLQSVGVQTVQSFFVHAVIFTQFCVHSVLSQIHQYVKTEEQNKSENGASVFMQQKVCADFKAQLSLQLHSFPHGLKTIQSSGQ